ncbi:SCO3242 family prenyltransferase [Streptomyces sp. CB01373]|uniref:SCO3242 family prenyltransferase n=1 Tax=Streptomyces sp. CB01373 TaxID=2020325 RepID=UPI000C27A810|nr:UbiA family prenyltransferase [Streptomyces sp. CB01373]PJM97659.1 prenyltransferase [Streptomyces sp. CB01373]
MTRHGLVAIALAVTVAAVVGARGSSARGRPRPRQAADPSEGPSRPVRADDDPVVSDDPAATPTARRPAADSVPAPTRTPHPSQRPALGTPADWVELLRLPALFTVPGDALAGAAAAGRAPGARTLLAVGSSLCLYQAGMALNDWADRAEDAAERPHRPLPSGRIAPGAALVAAGALTALGLALAARAGRPALTVAVPLAATVWAYDLGLKRNWAGPPAMAAARSLDLVLGAAASGGRVRDAVPSAAALGVHTLAVTAVSRRETQGGSAAVPLAALAVTSGVAYALVPPAVALRPPADRGGAAPLGPPGLTPAPGGALRAALALGYAATVARPLAHAVLNPSPPLTQRAVGGGIRAMIPLQAALSARAGAPVTALCTAALAPLARRFARKVSVT